MADVKQIYSIVNSIASQALGKTVLVDTDTSFVNLGTEILSYKVFFDLIIELESDLKLKTKITLDLPTGDIFENGIETLEETNMKTIFKRI